MIIRGLTLEIPNSVGKYIYKLLEIINPANFDWKLGFNEVHCLGADHLSDGQLFSDESYSGHQFAEMIQGKNYYAVFLEAFAYPPEAEKCCIRTYDDFLNSECQLILLISDCSYVSIYCKDKSMIRELYNHYLFNEVNGFKNQKYVSKDDPRTRMTVC